MKTAKSAMGSPNLVRKVQLVNFQACKNLLIFIIIFAYSLCSSIPTSMYISMHSCMVTILRLNLKKKMKSFELVFYVCFNFISINIFKIT